jgi:hypothetical protein
LNISVNLQCPHGKAQFPCTFPLPCSRLKLGNRLLTGTLLQCLILLLSTMLLCLNQVPIFSFEMEGSTSMIPCISKLYECRDVDWCAHGCIPHTKKACFVHWFNSTNSTIILSFWEAKWLTTQWGYNKERHSFIF